MVSNYRLRTLSGRATRSVSFGTTTWKRVVSIAPSMESWADFELRVSLWELRDCFDLKRLFVLRPSIDSLIGDAS